MFIKPKSYRLISIQTDPVVTMRLPEDILKALVLRSEENGSGILLEIILRLSRSLERDLDMLSADNELAYQSIFRGEKK